MLRNRPRRDLYYDGIRLVPVEGRTRKDSWHLPGGEVATTTELVKRAKARNVDIALHEREGAHVRMVNLKL